MKQTFLFTLLLLQCFWGFAQAPNKMSYQAVIRNSNNTVVSNHAVGMRVSILQGNATGSSVYTETQSPITNTNGLIAIEIGTGTIVSGSFSNIDWANGPYFVKTETDPNGGSNYILTGTSQLLSVPYALYAKKTDTAKVALNGIPSGSQHGQTLMNCDGDIVWTFNGQCPAKISAFNCVDTVHSGTLYNSVYASGVTSRIGYLGGNGFSYVNQSIASVGVLGLTATLTRGTLNSGNGYLNLIINGTPLNYGIAFFNIIIGNNNCVFQRTVHPYICLASPTTVVDVINPITGKTWMDRNLGASQAATSTTDAAAFGDLYQWGRAADGHQCRNSGTTTTLSTTDQPIHANFILAPNIPYDWRSPQNDILWQGLYGINNPCPFGHRLPTLTELDNERLSWTQNNSNGGFNSPLKLTLAGIRSYENGLLSNVGSNGIYWSSTTNGGNYPWTLGFNYGYVNLYENNRATGLSVRCIKD